MGNQIIPLNLEESFKIKEYVIKMGIEPVTFTNDYMQNIQVFNDYINKNSKIFKSIFADELEESVEDGSDIDVSTSWLDHFEKNKQFINSLSLTNPKFKINISKELKTREEIKVMLLDEIEKQ